jgi:hypothetical protein
MAIINCPECEWQVSSMAKACPQCGYPVSQFVVAPPKPVGRPSVIRPCPDCGVSNLGASELGLSGFGVSHDDNSDIRGGEWGGVCATCEGCGQVALVPAHRVVERAPKTKPQAVELSAAAQLKNKRIRQLRDWQSNNCCLLCGERLAPSAERVEVRFEEEEFVGDAHRECMNDGLDPFAEFVPPEALGLNPAGNFFDS